MLSSYSGVLYYHTVTVLLQTMYIPISLHFDTCNLKLGETGVTLKLQISEALSGIWQKISSVWGTSRGRHCVLWRRCGHTQVVTLNGCLHPVAYTEVAGSYIQILNVSLYVIYANIFLMNKLRSLDFYFIFGSS